MAFLWDHSRNGRFVIRMGQPLQLVAPNGAVVEVVGAMLRESAGELRGGIVGGDNVTWEPVELDELDEEEQADLEAWAKAEPDRRVGDDGELLRAIGFEDSQAAFDDLMPLPPGAYMLVRFVEKKPPLPKRSARSNRARPPKGGAAVEKKRDKPTGR